MKEILKFLPTLGVLTIIVWLFGFIIGVQVVTRDLKEAYKKSSDTYYFLNPQVTDLEPNAVADNIVVGLLNVGRCFDQKAESYLLKWVK